MSIYKILLFLFSTATFAQNALDHDLRVETGPGEYQPRPRDNYYRPTPLGARYGRRGSGFDQYRVRDRFRPSLPGDSSRRDGVVIGSFLTNPDPLNDTHLRRSGNYYEQQRLKRNISNYVDYARYLRRPTPRPQGPLAARTQKRLRQTPTRRKSQGFLNRKLNNDSSSRKIPRQRIAQTAPLPRNTQIKMILNSLRNEGLLWKEEIAPEVKLLAVFYYEARNLSRGKSPELYPQWTFQAIQEGFDEFMQTHYQDEYEEQIDFEKVEDLLSSDPE